MIILQSQISDIDLDTLTLELTSKFIETPFVNLDTLTMDMSLPTSPSLGLIQLDTLTLALSPTVIPANSPIVVALSSAVMTFVAKTIGFMQETGYAMKDLLSVLQQGGKAPVTPARFTDCDLMDIVDAFRAGTTQPKIPEDETCMMSDLLNALDIGNPIPFEVPIIGTWFGEQKWPEYIPSVKDAIIRVSGTTPFDVDISWDRGLTWADHPKPTIDTSTPPAGALSKLSYVGEGVLLFISWIDAGIINRGTNYGLLWTRMDISAYTTRQIGIIYSYESLTLVGDIYDGVNSANLLRSTNKGAAYTKYTISDAFCVNSITAIDSDTLLMCKRLKTGYGGIAKSTDGGVTWTNKYDTVLYNSALIKYTEGGIALCAEVGKYAYESQTMLRSTDYGETWVQIPNNIPISGYISFMEYLGNGIVLMVGSYGKVYRSSDYGLTWALVYNGSENITNIMNFGNGEILVTVYGYYSTIWLVRSVDYGLTWTLGARIVHGLYTFMPE